MHSHNRLIQIVAVLEMSRRKMIGLTATFLLLIAGGSVLGVVAGREIRDYRLQATIQDTRAEVQTYLDAHLTGIGAGSPFPSIPLWSADGTTSFYSDEVLPEGGILLYISADCGSCFASMTALQNTLMADGLDDRSAVVVAFGSPEPVVQYAKDNGIRLRIVFDVERILGREYGVTTFPTLIGIDHDHRVTALIPEARTEEFFRAYLHGQAM